SNRPRSTRYLLAMSPDPRAALLLRKVPEVLYIVPEKSEYKLDELVAIRDKLEIEGIKFGTLPEKRSLTPGDIHLVG
ncbi:hypothetical protein, partial [Ruegeria sp. HKCCD4884]|uniref:hypothetical protein n=1 Tax=Ruegeria sp. HKCCD4884 TaxID=2683022 RepID=UPI001C126C6D